MSNPKHPSPARVRAKVGAGRTRNSRLAIGQKYVAGQVAADPQNKLQTLAQSVGTVRTSLVALLGTKATLQAQLDTNQGAIVAADAQYAAALVGYADAAAAFADGDASVLAALGVEAAANPTKPGSEVIVAPVLTIAAGAASGEAKLKCGRVPYAGSYLFQYKLEPSLPTDPWLGNIATKLVSTMLSGLPAAQAVRARVQAIGVAPGPWSVEVVGRTK